jgi:hypothetical protein
MKLAIELLKDALTAAQKDEPLHRAAGEAKYARYCKAVAWDCIQAISVLQVVATQRAVTAKLEKQARAAAKEVAP